MLREAVEAAVAQERESRAGRRRAPCCRFIESNPQGRHHSRLDPEQLPAFLDQATEVLQNMSVGYGLWAYRAYRRNELHNGAFQQRLEGWGVDGCCGWPVDTDAENVGALGRPAPALLHSHSLQRGACQGAVTRSEQRRR